MSRHPAIKHLERALSRLLPCERAWFWLCPGADGAPLILSPLRSDADMSRLTAVTDRCTVPAGAVPRMGLATSDAEGRIQLCGPLLTPADLAALALFVSAAVSEHPALARLKGTRLLQTSASGVVQGVHHDDSLWMDVPDPVVIGTPAETTARIAALLVGDRAWFWMTDRGLGGRPAMMVVAQDDDPRGAQFAARLGILQRQCPAGGVSVVGVAQVLSSGLVLTTESDLDTTARLLRSLGRPGRIARLEGGSVVATRTVTTDPFHILADHTGPLVFWFTRAGRDGIPVLLIDADRAVLKAAARQHAGDGPTARGTLRISETGEAVISPRSGFSGLRAALSGFIARSDSPGLSRLADAQIIAPQRAQRRAS